MKVLMLVLVLGTLAAFAEPQAARYAPQAKRGPSTQKRTNALERALGPYVDLAGTWHVDPTTRQMGHIPTNFMAFALTLNADGTFIATNVPAGFFSSSSAIPDARGTWTCSYRPEDDVHYFGLNFHVPQTQGYYGTRLKWRRSGLAFVSPWEPLIRIYIDRKPGQASALEFGLARQR